jgi:LemA protein
MRDMTIRDLLQFDWLQLRVVPLVAIIVGSLALIWILLVLWRGNNRLAALENRCNTAEADIDAHLKLRHNLIPGLVESVRGYVHHENEVLIAVAQANADALRASSQQARMDAEVQLGNSINSLLQAAQKYPDLKASVHFSELRQQLSDVENRVTAARRFFNLTTEEYNNQLGRFPSNLVARLQKRARRLPYSLGEERAALDAPLAIQF